MNTISSKQPTNVLKPPVYTWRCELFGTDDTLVLSREEGKQPCWFWRKMQFLLVGNRWSRIKDTIPANKPWPPSHVGPEGESGQIPCAALKTPNTEFKIPAKPPPPGKWIPWQGGKCPVGELVRVDVSYSDGSIRLSVLSLHLLWQTQYSDWQGDGIRFWRISAEQDIMSQSSPTRPTETNTPKPPAPAPLLGNWAAWQGGECPVYKEVKVDVIFADGYVFGRVPAGYVVWVGGGIKFWQISGPLEVVSQAGPTPKPPEPPERTKTPHYFDASWTLCLGNICPTDDEARIDIGLRCGSSLFNQRAGDLSWKDHGRSFDILFWRISAGPKLPDVRFYGAINK